MAAVTHNDHRPDVSTEIFTPYTILSTCKGGGYLYCRTSPPHPRANAKGLYPLHRVILENKLGRHLGAHEQVHHIDEDKSNNSPENLVALTAADHRRAHKKVPRLVCCSFCGAEFGVLPGVERRRRKESKFGGLYCSRTCSSLSRPR